MSYKKEKIAGLEINLRTGSKVNRKEQKFSISKDNRYS